MPGFDYQSETKNAYRASGTADRYHAAFAGEFSLSRLPARFVAAGERRVVAAMLAHSLARSVIDVPVGTGKLAPVFARLGLRVFAADISDEMLAHAKRSLLSHRVDLVACRTGDVETLREWAPPGCDVVVCLRLMHRVPPEVRRRMFAQIAEVAPLAIISFGADSRFHRVRRALRAVLFGGDRSSLCMVPLQAFEAELAPHFEIRSRQPVLPLLSAEFIYLLRSRAGVHSGRRG